MSKDVEDFHRFPLPTLVSAAGCAIVATSCVAKRTAARAHWNLMPITSRFVVRSTSALLAIGLIALIAIVATTGWLSERAQSIFREAIEAREARGAAVGLRDGLRTAESSQRGYLATANEIYLAPYDAAKAVAQKQLELVAKGYGPDHARAPMLRRLAAATAEKLQEMDRTVALKVDGKGDEALAMLRTNRGKALMDEINVFLTSILLDADERLTTIVTEQNANAVLLRLVSIVGGGVIILVVAGMVFMLSKYTSELVQARDEVRNLNMGLEDRVLRRTAELSEARERAELLLAEVNHRVANSLTLVSSMVRLQSGALDNQAAKDALAEIQSRILAISAVHKRLYTSSDVTTVQLQDYLASLLANLESAMRSDGHKASVRHSADAIELPTNEGVNLGVIVAEWVTNAFKYAYPNESGEIRVRLSRLDDKSAELVVEDDGIGKGTTAEPKGTGVGTRIVNAMARSMNGQVEYQPLSPGTRARLQFALKHSEAGGRSRGQPKRAAE